MSPRLTSEYPEKFTLRCTMEQRVNFITMAWLKGMEGKFGLSIRWFMDKYFPVWYASLTDEERTRFEEMKKRVVLEEDYPKYLLPEEEIKIGE